ncbi:UDP-glycosyltransferase 83A1-like [Salvia miltiorrhiza]|uniref:UDP-glycosyltransferase 83A1-like n=1 Tax=Salvia miltiorrhiza TaxID=226208 RepID=UPI0025AC7AE8|nr:UDP-glycosyltransferase 83A1-like [Salvia miltiorrhiza]
MCGKMGATKGKRGHVLAVPFPAQGHVTPLLKFSRLIASHGVKLTFVNTHFIHNKLAAATNSHAPQLGVVLASISDGLPDDDDRSDAFKLWESLNSTMAGHLTELIEKINASNCDEKISCIIADVTLEWILELARDFGAQSFGFTPASAASLAMVLQIPNLIHQGNLDLNGTLKGIESVRLTDEIPAWRKDEFAWSFPIDLKTQKIMLECCLCGEKSARFRSTWLLCNTFYELESSACDLSPKLLPIGPLLDSQCRANCSSFYVEDTSCLRWLDEKAVASVIYVSFGSLAVLSHHQLQELALGLELSGRPFLWVVRSNLTNDGSRVEYPEGFLGRVCSGGLGKIVEWAPQERVLSHPSVGCFLSHCGWNSTLEGLAAALPFLCWPYFADQYHNQSYVCDKWKIGLRIEQDENGIRGRDEIKKKIEIVVGDDDIKANALRLKEMATMSVAQEGSSFLNFQRFIDHLIME